MYEYESPSMEFLCDMDLAGVNAGSAAVVVVAVAVTIALAVNIAGVAWNVGGVVNWAAAAVLVAAAAAYTKTIS